MELPFRDRTEAGRVLGQALGAYAGRPNGIVLAIPRGGVPVGFEAARRLRLPLDVLLVRKLGLPGHEELAIGAVASGGVSVLNRDVVTAHWIGDETIEAIAVKERRELERRERLYRYDRPLLEVKGCCVIVVDDGAATAAILRAGVLGLRQRGPARVVAAVPVASREAVARLREAADEVICLASPEPFIAVGRWYRDFSRTTDGEVRNLLVRTWAENPG